MTKITIHVKDFKVVVVNDRPQRAQRQLNLVLNALIWVMSHSTEVSTLLVALYSLLAR